MTELPEMMTAVPVSRLVSTAPPMPLSTSSNTKVGTLVKRLVTTCKAKEMRDNSPPEATLAMGRKSPPLLAATKNWMCSKPCTPAALVSNYPWLLAVALFFASMLLYSQAATAKAIMPAVVLALGITPANNGQVYILVASFAAVSALFVLPTYPTLLGAIQMDDTGSTRIGRFVFNHSFLLPGVLAIVFAVALGFLVAPLVL